MFDPNSFPIISSDPWKALQSEILRRKFLSVVRMQPHCEFEGRSSLKEKVAINDAFQIVLMLQGCYKFGLKEN